MLKLPDAMVHIGFNKCGSTAIQKWLGDNRVALAAQGFGHRHTDPRSSVICSNPQFGVLAHTLAKKIMPPHPLKAALNIEDGNLASQDAVMAEFERNYCDWLQRTDFDRYLISSEYLGAGLGTQELITGLDLWIRQNIGPAKYVAYIRRPAAWLISVHGHEMRRKRDFGSLEELAARLSPVPYIQRLQAWFQAIGPDRLEVRLFDEAWLKGGGLIANFCAAIGADMSRTNRRPKLANVSYNDAGIPWHPRMWRAPDRPRFDAAAEARIAAANAKGMAWIERTFFQGREDQFQRWLNPDTEISK